MMPIFHIEDLHAPWSDFVAVSENDKNVHCDQDSMNPARERVVLLDLSGGFVSRQRGKVLYVGRRS